jgi:OmpA family
LCPKHTTTYHFEASGPGGTVKQDATVDVNTVVQSSLDVTPAEVAYIKVGNKVLTQESSELKWTASNADAISLSPVGNVATSGEQKLTPEPQQTQGQINETQAYTLNASNVCGGSEAKTVRLKISGVIEPYVLSVFFPTAYPTRRRPDAGLVASEQARLAELASVFLAYAAHTPDAKIVVTGHADRRGTDKYNMSLSERRVAAVKAFLVARGIPEDKITVQAVGKREQLDMVTVQQLEGENPFKTDAAQKQKARTTWLGYNRRTDVEIQPADVQTTRFYPNQASDAELLMQRRLPSLKKVEDAQAQQEVTTVGGTPGGQE